MPATMKHPKAAETWRDNLRAFSMKVGFHLNLSRPMMEFLSAVADDVEWDRRLYNCQTNTDNWKASELSLTKRGLIQRKPDEWFEANKHVDRPRGEHCCCVLTPAGKCVVDLLKFAGLFVESDAAINRKTRRA